MLAYNSLKVNKPLVQSWRVWFLAGILTILSVYPVFARVSISRIRLTVTAVDQKGDLQVEPGSSSDEERYVISQTWVDEEFLAGYFDKKKSETYSGQVYIIELQAQEEYYFEKKPVVTFKETNIQCIETSYQEKGEYLYVKCVLEDALTQTNEIEPAVWKEEGRLGWNAIAGASVYELQLYRGEQAVGRLYTTKGIQYDFRPLIQQEGTYWCQIRSFAVNGSELALRNSDACYVSGSQADTYRVQYEPMRDAGGNVYSGWKMNRDRWWFKNTDGMYEQDNWQMIDGSWYYFDESGYMVSDQWVTWKGARFYMRSDGSLQP